MKTVLLGDPPPEVEQMLARRAALGQDRHDEVWDGVLHVAPHAHTHHGIVDRSLAGVLEPYARDRGLIGSTAMNIGGPGNYRVPDGGYYRELPDGVYATTAAVVVEIRSPDDETFEKFGFYAAADVEEVIVAEPSTRTVGCFDPATGEARPVSLVLGADMAVVTAAVSWP